MMGIACHLFLSDGNPKKADNDITHIHVHIKTYKYTLHISIHHSIPAVGVDHSFDNTFGFVVVSFRDPLDQFQPYSVLATAADAVDRINQAI